MSYDQRFAHTTFLKGLNEHLHEWQDRVLLSILNSNDRYHGQVDLDHDC